MSRFFAPKENIKDNLIHIDGREARHIQNVMRLKESDKVVVFDGTGAEYTGFIKEVKPKSLTVEIISTKLPAAETPPEITLAQAIPKRGKMDYIVEKATELGVRGIIPIISERTIVRVESGKEPKKIERWRKIALAASKQCGRRDVPEIKEPQKFYNAIDKINNFDLALMPCFSESVIPIKEALSDLRGGRTVVFIGPEGDFTPEEIEMARNTTCKLVSLGKKVLKSDTAGLYVLSVLNYELSR